MWNIFTRLTKRYLGAKGRVIDVQFKVGNRTIMARVPDDQLQGVIEELLILEDYEVLNEFRLDEHVEGWSILDAGAHVGLYTLKAAAYVRSQGKVIAIEPHPANYRLLIENIRANKMSNIQALEKALWTRSGEVNLEIGGHTDAHRIVGLGANRSIKVQALTLGQIINRIGHVDLLKMDIEGAEYEVLMRSRQALAHVERIVVELHSVDNIHNLARALEDYGFRVILSTQLPFLSLRHSLRRIQHSPLSDMRKLKSAVAMAQILYHTLSRVTRRPDALLLLWGVRH